MADRQYQTPKPYEDALANILEEARKIYEAKKGEGFQTYDQPRIAGFTPEEQAAMSGIAGLVGAGRQYFDPAAQLTKGLGQRFTADTAQQYMSPYQQAVVDVEKREAVRQAERGMQDIGAAAVGAGGFGGSRQAILEAEAGRNLQQQLGDIQTRGSQAAFETGQRAFEAQKARERQAASGLMSLGQQAPRQALAELTALSGIGEAQRGMQQQGLDLAYQDFMKRQQYPYDLLGQYQSTVYGYPYQSFAQYQPAARPSAAQNLAGILGAVGKVGSSFGFFNTGGRVAYRSKGGLSGMIKNLQTGSTVGSDDDFKTPTKADILRSTLESLGFGKDLVEEQKKFREQQQKAADEKLAKLERERSPIAYGSDVLLGFAAADPESSLGLQIAEGVQAAEENRPDLDEAKFEVQKALAEGRISEIEAQAKLKEIETKTLTDVYELMTPTNYLIGVEKANKFADYLENNYNMLGQQAGKVRRQAMELAKKEIAENPSMYDTEEKQDSLMISLLDQLGSTVSPGGGTPADPSGSDNTIDDILNAAGRPNQP